MSIILRKKRCKLSDAKSEMKKINELYLNKHPMGPHFQEKLEQVERDRLELGKALRYNEGKLKWHNFPMFLIKPLAQVADYGASKYETFNFLKGAPINQYMDSLKRHLTSFEDPTESDIDPESQQNHLAHVAWNALVALYVLNNVPELDNRYKLPLRNQNE